MEWDETNRLTLSDDLVAALHSTWRSDPSNINNIFFKIYSFVAIATNII